MSVTTTRKCLAPSCGNALDERDDWTRADGRCSTCVEAWELLLADILTTPCGSTVDTGAGPGLIVHQRVFPDGTTLGNIKAGASASQVVLTGDGRRYEAYWHTGPEAEWVYMERWNADGREAHGWIDSVSRRLLQAG